MASFALASVAASTLAISLLACSATFSPWEVASFALASASFICARDSLTLASPAACALVTAFSARFIFDTASLSLSRLASKSTRSCATSSTFSFSSLVISSTFGSSRSIQTLIALRPLLYHLTHSPCLPTEGQEGCLRARAPRKSSC